MYAYTHSYIQKHTCTQRHTHRETRRQTRRSLDVPGRQEESRGAVTAGGRGTEGRIARGTVDMACTDVSTGAAPSVILCALRYVTVHYVTLRYVTKREEIEEKIAEEGRNKRRGQKQERKTRREEKSK